jgi:hypothetical protein
MSCSLGSACLLRYGRQRSEGCQGTRNQSPGWRLSILRLGACVYVFELTRPGTWLDNLPDEVSFDVDRVLDLLESTLADAALSLGLFEAEQAASTARHAQHRQEWEQNRAAEAALVAAYESELASHVLPEERWRLDEQTRERARIEAKRARWQSGQLPDAYAHRLPFVHARSCVYALDTIGKAIKSLARMPGLPAGVAQARADFEARFPTLVSIRDSAHHPEDRVRGVRGRPGGGDTDRGAADRE